MSSLVPSALITAVLSALQHIQNNPESFRKRCFIGFDGFTDEIISVVDRRLGPDEFQRIETIQQLGERITAAAGKSCNIELVTRLQKLGGNAPILANALLEGGHAITFAGAIGHPGAIEPLFSDLAQRCVHTLSLCPSAHSDALEFCDGKIILGKHNTLSQVNYNNLLKAIDRSALIAQFEALDLFASVNWTMLLSMNSLWEKLLIEILPHLSLRSEQQPRWLFVDLADPAKRTDSDLNHALTLLARFRPYFRVVLGLNRSEAARVGTLCGADTTAPLSQLAQHIAEKAHLDSVVIHSARSTTATLFGQSATVDGPYCPKPQLTTGAGDNFNAGFCNGLLYGLSIDQALLLGVSTSGFYVRNGHSPTLGELTQFLQDWNNGALDATGVTP